MGGGATGGGGAADASLHGCGPGAGVGGERRRRGEAERRTNWFLDKSPRYPRNVGVAGFRDTAAGLLLLARCCSPSRRGCGRDRRARRRTGLRRRQLPAPARREPEDPTPGTLVQNRRQPAAAHLRTEKKKHRKSGGTARDDAMAGTGAPGRPDSLSRRGRPPRRSRRDAARPESGSGFRIPAGRRLRANVYEGEGEPSTEAGSHPDALSFNVDFEVAGGVQ